MSISSNFSYEAAEVEKFDRMAKQWWDLDGPCKPLHQINPLRLSFVQRQIGLADKKVLDVGCGGGILTESLAQQHAHVLGIDLSEGVIQAACKHASDKNLAIDYRVGHVDSLLPNEEAQFDVITCMELLEHVPSPSQLIRTLSRLLKKGGYIFFSTLNRNIKSFLLGIVAAEYILQLLPQGTHDYAKFIRPSELVNEARNFDLTLCALEGMRYNPFSKTFTLSPDLSVNYLASFQKKRNE